MFKIAILGVENSHADSFLKSIKEDSEYSDIEVVGIYSDETEPVTKLANQYGVPIMKEFDELAGKIDGLVVTARHGDNHYKYAKPYIASGIPMFIDKPITISEDEAVKFMKELKESGVKVCGGSVCVFYETVQEMKKLVSSTPVEEVLGGVIRAPLDANSQYGGFFFYAQHLVSMMTEIFGMYPKSVIANENGKGIDAIVSYGDFDVTLNYAYRNYNYFAGVSTKNDFVIKRAEYKPEFFKCEFDEFYNMLHGKDQPRSYNDFIAPVFIMNAIVRSLKSHRLEEVNRAPKI